MFVRGRGDNMGILPNSVNSRFRRIFLLARLDWDHARRGHALRALMMMGSNANPRQAYLVPP